jgi:glutaredoxin
VQSKVELYGRGYCHLCHEMAAALRALHIAFVEIDLDSDPRLEDLYGEDIPVLLKDGVEICRHRLTAEAIEKLS